MTTLLQQRYDALSAARQTGNLTIAAGHAGDASVDRLLAALPSASLALKAVDVELVDDRQPASLVVSGAIAGTWTLPVPGAGGLRVQTATFTYTQARETAPLTATLTMTATLAIGVTTVSLTGSLRDGGLRFDGPAVPGAVLSLGDAVTLATEGRANGYLPLGLVVFDSLSPTALSLSFGAGGGGVTRIEFSLDAQPDATWELVPGAHVLREIGVAFVSSFRYSSSGPRPSFGGRVHAKLALGGLEFDASVALQPSHIWEVDVVSAQGLPAIQTLAAIAGAGGDVAQGLASLGLGDLELRAVRLGFDRAAGKLSFIAIQGSMSLAGAVVDVSMSLPALELGGALSPATPLSLTTLLEHQLGAADGLPDVEITELALSAAPGAGRYALSIELADGEIAAGSYGLRDALMSLEKSGGVLAGSISAAITVAGTDMLVSGIHGPGWTVTGQLDRLSLAAVVREMLADVDLPGQLKELELSDVSGSWNLSTGSFAFAGTVDLDVDLGPSTLAASLALAIQSTVVQGMRTTTGKLTGSLRLNEMVFTLTYDLTPGHQVLRGSWTGTSHADFTSLASAFGLTPPPLDVPLPDLSLRAMSFEVDWSKAGEQAVHVTATTSIGTAFFVVDRPRPGAPWGFVFGAEIRGAQGLSAVLAPLGLRASALDVIRLRRAFFLVCSAAFPALQLPGFSDGGVLQVSAGVSAGVLVDLDGSKSRPDVTALKQLLPSPPPGRAAGTLLGEVTLSRSIASVALTVRLAGSVALAGSSLTLTDVALVLKPQPFALSLRGTIAFAVGDAHMLATGRLTVGMSGVTAAFDLQAQDGQALPIPMGLRGVHLTDIGVEIGVTLEPPAVELGLLGRFTIGAAGPAPTGRPVAKRSLAAVPPADEFVMIMGLEGDVPNPLLLSMYLAEVSLGTALEALTDQKPANLPALVTDLRASDVMLYWCDAPAGVQQPDGTWAYPGFGFNATLDLFGFDAHGALKIDATKGFTGDACIDPLHIAGVIDLTGAGPGTPPAYTGAVAVKPGGAKVHVSTLASPYLDVDVVASLFRSAHVAVDAQLTKSGFTFAFAAAAGDGFSSTLQCTVARWTHLAIAFSVALNLDLDLGTVEGTHLGHVRVADTGFAAKLVVDVASGFSLTIDGSFEFDGARYAMPQVSEVVAYGSLAEIPLAIAGQLEQESATIFKGLTREATAYADLVRRGVVAGADSLGVVLRGAYRLSSVQAAIAMSAAGYAASAVTDSLRDGYRVSAQDAVVALKMAGYALDDVSTALKRSYAVSTDQAVQVLRDAQYDAREVAHALQQGFGISSGAAARALRRAGFAASAVGDGINRAYQLSDQEMARTLREAGYAIGDIGGTLKRLYSVSADRATEILRVAGYEAGDIAHVLRSSFGVTAQDATRVLKAAGYAVDVVGDSIRREWALPAADVASALRGAGYASNEAGAYITSAFNPGSDELKRVLKGAGYAASEVEGFFGSIADKLDPRHWF